MDKTMLERESDAPAGWKTNAILCKDGKGNVIEMTVPDDGEVDGDVQDDTAL